jgi:hypothetical protein
MLAAVLVLASCGGSPSAPSSPAAPPQVLPVSLAPGSYTLTITPSTSAGSPPCVSNGACVLVSVCAGTPDTTPARFDVQVDRTGDDARITAGGGAQSLAMLLHTASMPANGTISGGARDTRGVMVEAIGKLTGNGSSNAAIAASGNIDGQVNTASGGCSNNGHTWTLSRNQM